MEGDDSAVERDAPGEAQGPVYGVYDPLEFRGEVDARELLPHDPMLREALADLRAKEPFGGHVRVGHQGLVGLAHH